MGGVLPATCVTGRGGGIGGRGECLPAICITERGGGTAGWCVCAHVHAHIWMVFIRDVDV